MFKALLLLALIGLGSALQSGVSYQYQYNGRVGTAIPQLRSQAAATAIKMTVNIEMKDDKTAMVQFIGPQAGVANKDVGSQLRAPVEISYQPIPKDLGLEEPFIAHLGAEEGETVLEVPSGELTWVTNVRISVVQSFRTSAMKTNMQISAVDPVTNMIKNMHGVEDIANSVFEDTLLGRCVSEYTMTKLEGSLAHLELEKVKAQMKEDAQSGKKSSSVPGVSSDMWLLVRSINTRRCPDEVMLQHSGAGNTSVVGIGQFEHVASRTSVGQYIIQGQPGKFRLVRAVIEGGVTINPFGLKTDEVAAITNQTLILNSVPSSPISVKPGSNLMKITTWKFRVVSPNSAPQREWNKRSWVHYEGKGSAESPIPQEFVLTGMRLTEPIKRQYVETVEKVMEKAVADIIAVPKSPSTTEKPFGTSTGEAARRLQLVSRIISSLPKPELQQVFSKMTSGSGETGDMKKMLIIDAFAASGSGPAVKVLMENIKNKKISNERAASVFMTLVSSLHAPALMKDIVEVSKTWSLEREPLTASVALVNTATMARQQCMKERFRNYTVPLPVIGNQDCEGHTVISGDFIPYLKQQLQSASEPWQRSIIVLALGKTGAKEAVQVLEPVISGQKEKFTKVRVAAVLALSRRHLPAELRHEVFSVLMERIMDISDATELRQAAVGVALSWQPDEGFWQQLAALTWREPSRQMSTFIASTIYGVAKFNNPRFIHQSRMASHANLRAKPAIASWRYSYNHIVSGYYNAMEASTLADFSWLTNPASVVPKELYAFLRTTFGTYSITLAEAAANIEGVQSIVNKVIESLQAGVSTSGLPTPHDPSFRRAHEIVQKYKDALNPVLKSSDQPEAELYLSLFDNMQYVLPLNEKAITKASGGEDLLKLLTSGPKKIHMTKFINAIPIQTFLPTDIGIPLVSEFATPILQVAEGETKVTAQGASSMSDIANLRHAEAESSVNFRIIAKAISKLQVHAPWSNKTVFAGLDTEKTINLPMKTKFTFRRPTESQAGTWNVSVAMTAKYNEEHPIVYAHNAPFTAIREMLLTQDVSQVTDIKTVIMRSDRQPAITEEMRVGKEYLGIDGRLRWVGDAINPIGSGLFTRAVMRPQMFLGALTSGTSRMWRLNLMMNPGSSEAKAIKIELSNQRRDFIISGSQGDIADLTVTGYIQSQPSLQSAQPLRYFAALARYQAAGSGSSLASTWQLNGLRGPIPSDSTQKMLCNEIKMTSPKVTSLEQLRSILQSQVKADLTGQMILGRTCEQEKQVVATLKGSVEVSNPRKQQLAQELQRSSTLYTNDPTVAFPIAAVYDSLDTTITWVPSMPKPILNATYLINDYVRGIAFPFISHNYIDINNQANTLKIQANRPLSTPMWRVMCQMPREEFIISRMYLPRWVDGIVPMAGLRAPLSEYPRIFIESAAMPDQCIVTPTQVRTFDSVEYFSGISGCWTEAAALSTQDTPFLISTAVVQTQLRGRIAIPAHSKVIEVTSEAVWVNGKEQSVSSKPIVVDHVRISKVGSGIQVELPNEYIVVMSQNRMVVHMSPKYKGRMAGLCGDFNGESKNDLQDPKHCIYSPSKSPLFVSSWTTPGGQSCDESERTQNMTQVHEFQKNCPKANPSVSASVTQLTASGSSSCEHRAFRVVKIQESQPELCVTDQKEKVCTHGCHTASKSTAQLTLHCFPEASAPAEVKNAYNSNRYMEEPCSKPGRITRKAVPVTLTCQKN